MKIKTISNYGPTIAEAKQYLRVENNLDDMLIGSLVTASYQQVCNEANRDFAPTVTSIDIISGSTEFITIQEVDSVNSGSLQIRNDGSYIVFDDIFTGKLIYTTATSASIPDTVRIAQLMLVSQWYDQRSPVVVGASVSKLDFAVEALLSPYKLVDPS
jgi:uncharacterized protein YfaT (DUF1175 family)